MGSHDVWVTFTTYPSVFCEGEVGSKHCSLGIGCTQVPIEGDEEEGEEGR